MRLLVRRNGGVLAKTADKEVRTHHRVAAASQEGTAATAAADDEDDHGSVSSFASAMESSSDHEQPSSLQPFARSMSLCSGSLEETPPNKSPHQASGLGTIEPISMGQGQAFITADEQSARSPVTIDSFEAITKPYGGNQASSRLHSSNVRSVCTSAAGENEPGATPRPRHRYVCILIQKPSAGTRLGAVLTKDASSGAVYIATLRPFGLFHETPLREGDELLTVNGKLCVEMSKSDVVDLMRQIVGQISITARSVLQDPLPVGWIHSSMSANSDVVETLLEKPEHGIIMGISVSRSSTGILEIAQIRSNGLAAQAFLSVGDRVLSINGIGCSRFRSAQEAVDMIRHSPRFVSLVTEVLLGADPDWESDSIAETREEESVRECTMDRVPDDSCVRPHLPEQPLVQSNDSCAIQPLAKPKNKPKARVSCLLKFTEPDIYGQRHPIETPELIEAALYEFDKAVDELPESKKSGLNMAWTNCPDMLDDKFKLMFLRADCFRPHDAANRYAVYWDRRIDVFGTSKAFKPFTQKDSLSEQERKILRSGVVNPIYIGGRLHSFQDLSKLTSKGLTSKGPDPVSNFRVIWYMSHLYLEDEEFQRKGNIGIVWMKGLRMNQVDTEGSRRQMQANKGVLPVRVSALHVIHAPRFVTTLVSIFSFVIPERIKKRMHFHNGSEEKVLQALAKFGMKTEELPVQLGGKVVVETWKWMDELYAVGK